LFFLAASHVLLTDEVSATAVYRNCILLSQTTTTTTIITILHTCQTVVINGRMELN